MEGARRLQDASEAYRVEEKEVESEDVWHLHGSCRGSILKECQRRRDTGNVVDRPQLQ